MRNSKWLWCLSLVISNALVAQSVPKRTGNSNQRLPSPAVKVWDKEPISFFGAVFGKPIALSVQECPKENKFGADRYVIQYDGPICFQTDRGSTMLANAPRFGNVFLQEEAGNVAALFATCSADYSSEALNALETKFGQPTTLRTERVRSKAGVEYSNTIAEWIGKALVLHFETIGSRVDEGSLSVMTTEYLAEFEKRSEESQKKVVNSF